jgi:ribonuclease D
MANKEETVLIDPFNKELDMLLIKKILFSLKILKIFHAAYQDLEIFFNLFKQLPKNIIDTQICISLLGLSDSLGYADSIDYFLKKKIDKTYQFIDWRKRPLSKKKINYASNDVKYLIPLYMVILKKLKKKKFKDIHKYHIKLLDRKTYLKKPSLAWQKIKIRSKESHKLNLLKEICKKRELTAKTKNIPVKRLIKDQEIKYISNKKTNYSDRLKILNSIKDKSFKEELKKIVLKYD